MAKFLHKDLDGLVSQLRGDLFVRWMKQAQKAALLLWRDRSETPGLQARFTRAGDSYYGFTPRAKSYNRRKGGLPDFVYTTGLREMMKSRQPKSLNTGNTEAVTRIKFGGGALNFLTAVKKTVGFVVSIVSTKTQVKAYFRGTKTVKGYEGTRKHKTISRTRGTVNYAEEYGRLTRDMPWLQNKVKELFLAIFRKAGLTKSGQLRSTAVEGIDTRGGA
jgi:hypothetical protein